MTEPHPWLGVAVERIRHLKTLGDNWDSYGAARVAPDVADTMIRFLSDPMWAATSRPAIVPTAEGGLAVEWRNDRAVIEVEFGPLGAAEAYVCDEFGTEWEGDLTEVPGGIAAWSQHLAGAGS